MRDDPPRGAAYVLAAGAGFAVMGAMVKILARDLPDAQVVFLRNAVGLAVLAPAILFPGAPTLATREIRTHLVRSLAGLAAMVCFFHALARLPVATAVLLNYTTPLFIPFTARVGLGERTAPRTWAAIAVGFAGLLLILRPEGDAFRPAAAVGLAAGLFAAVAMTGIRALGRTEPPFRSVFYFALVGTILSAPFAASVWRAPGGAAWLLAVAMGAVATASQICLTRGYALAPAPRVGPFIYGSVLFAGAIDAAFWGLRPDALALAGAGLVVTAGVLPRGRGAE